MTPTNSVATKTTHNEISSRNQTRKLRAFSLGFAEGFGSVGCIFLAVKQVPEPYWLRQAGEASAPRRRMLIEKAKQHIVTGFVGAAMAKKLCSVPVESDLKSSLWAKDRATVGNDNTNALTKLHG